MSTRHRASDRRSAGWRCVTAAFVAGLASFAFLPSAYADTPITLAPSVEAWYQPNPSCATPAGCQNPSGLPAKPPAQSPYPAGTLHVGFSAGQETARSYLGLPFGTVVGAISSGSLTVPLDTAQASGSSKPDTAKIQICLTMAPLTAAEGSFDAPPKVDCSASVPATYVATPAPHLQADLSPLVAMLPSATGLALLPDATKSTPTDSWRVVFSAHTRSDAAKTAPAAVTLSLAEPPADSSPQPAVVDYPSEGSAALSGITPATGTGFAALPQVNLPAVQVPAVTSPQLPQPAAAPVASTQTITVGYAYPVVWLLPLGFLLVVPLAVRGLTRDLTPV